MEASSICLNGALEQGHGVLAPRALKIRSSSAFFSPEASNPVDVHLSKLYFHWTLIRRFSMGVALTAFDGYQGEMFSMS